MMHSPMRLKISQWLWHSFPICVISSSASPQENRVPTGRFRKSYPSTIRFSPKAPSGISAPFARKASIFSYDKRLTWRCQCPACASPSMPQSSTSFAVSTSCFAVPRFSLIQIPMIFPISFVSSSFRTAVISSADAGHQMVLCHILRPLKAVFHRLF